MKRNYSPPILKGFSREPRSSQLPLGAGGAVHQAEKELLRRLRLPVQVHLRGLRRQGKLKSYHMAKESR